MFSFVKNKENNIAQLQDIKKQQASLLAAYEKIMEVNSIYLNSYLAAMSNLPFTFSTFDPKDNVGVFLLLCNKLMEVIVQYELYKEKARVVLFLHNVKIVDLLQENFNWCDYGYHSMSGSITKAVGGKAIDAFNVKGEGFIFMPSIRTGGLCK